MSSGWTYELGRRADGSEVKFSAMARLDSAVDVEYYKNDGILAVYYLLGEECDRDPFLIFQMRGMSRDGLIDLLSGAETAPAGDGEPAPDPAGTEPLPVTMAAFSTGSSQPGEMIGDVRIPATAAALPRQLGHFPFWQGAAPLSEMLEPVNARVSPRALDMVVGRNVTAG